MDVILKFRTQYFMCICAKYEVSIIKPVARTVHRLRRCWTTTPNDQFMIVQLFGICAKWANNEKFAASWNMEVKF